MIMRFALMMLCLLTMLPSAFAEETAKTFAVAPFAIHGPKDYQYLQKGIPAMLQTRLTWTDHFTPVSKDIVEQHAADPIADTTAAQKALTGIASDYLVYGSVTIMGQECSLDVQLMDKAGKVSPFASQTTLDQLIPSLETTAKQING
ncbi:MAG: VCBS repeat-containing protein, partial [Desulfoplanes sp.]|nr:VCBS repeat-containing protein [Desulfoplanes sp.]